MLVTEAGNWKGMKRLNGMDNRYSGVDDITCTSSGAKLFKPAKPAEALALSTTLSILIYNLVTVPTVMTVERNQYQYVTRLQVKNYAVRDRLL
jgi:hypothetical protein